MTENVIYRFERNWNNMPPIVKLLNDVINYIEAELLLPE